MITLLTSDALRAAGLARAARGLARLGLQGVRAVVRTVLHRREVSRLLELDDRALKDIGLLRGDILGALSGGWDRDPSAILAGRSVERRARSHALDLTVARHRTGPRPDRRVSR